MMRTNLVQRGIAAVDPIPRARKGFVSLSAARAIISLLSAMLFSISCGSGQEKSARGGFSADAVTVSLGDPVTVGALYSYTPGTQGLDETVEHYLLQSLSRDGFRFSAATVTQTDGAVQATIISDDPAVEQYSSVLPAFLDNGKLALQAVASLKKQGKWPDDWRMFLPLGLAMVNQQSLQLLHFPPDYSLTDMDYLNSSTSKRWETLLLVNGQPKDKLTLLETIVDIAPIAAPSNQGSKIDTAPFTDYVKAQLGLLARAVSSSENTIPMVSYGSPVAKWIERVYGKHLRVLSTAFLEISPGRQTPLIHANHPSYFWYAWDDSVESGWKVMLQDLTAACWQVETAANPNVEDLEQIKDDCYQKWIARPNEVCVLIEMQGCDASRAEAESLCADNPQSPPPCSQNARPDIVDRWKGLTGSFSTEAASYIDALRQNGMLDATQVEALTQRLGVDIDTLMVLLLPAAQQSAVPEISDFYVGAVARGLSNSLYVGGNVEFQGQSLAYVVHAEQSAVNNALLNGETGIRAIAVSAPPCGYCRQFLFEIDHGADIEVILPDKDAAYTKTPLRRMLPDAFGPSDLNMKGGLMNPKMQEHPLVLSRKKTDPLIDAALHAAASSYAPYTGGFAGCAVETADHKIFAGQYAENAAYNPSLSAMGSALSFMNVKSGKDKPSAKIVRAVLVEVPAKTSQKDACEDILSAEAPGIRLEYIPAKSAK